MTEGFDRLKARRSRLPDPPPDSSDNLRAPETAPAPAQPVTPPMAAAASEPSVEAAAKPRIDGRARLRKDRTEALSTKIKPGHRELLMSLADAYGSTISETLEHAIDALAAEAKRAGRTLT